MSEKLLQQCWGLMRSEYFKPSGRKISLEAILVTPSKSDCGLIQSGGAGMEDSSFIELEFWEDGCLNAALLLSATKPVLYNSPT